MLGFSNSERLRSSAPVWLAFRFFPMGPSFDGILDSSFNGFGGACPLLIRSFSIDEAPFELSGTPWILCRRKAIFALFAEEAGLNRHEPLELPIPGCPCR